MADFGGTGYSGEGPLVERGYPFVDSLNLHDANFRGFS